jgi:hypothetical protein
VTQTIHFMLNIAQTLVSRAQLSIFDLQGSVVVLQFVERL